MIKTHVMVMTLLVFLGFSLNIAGAADIYLRDGSLWLQQNTLDPDDPNVQAMLTKQPILFVHGHRLSLFFQSDPANDPHYLRTWVIEPDYDSSLSSFAKAIQDNPGLNLEPFYLNFGLHNRSIVEDAQDIAWAVGRLVALYNPMWEPHKPLQTQIAIIAFSKGTISTRVYLKNLFFYQIHQDEGVTEESPYFEFVDPQPMNPVSEFVAIAPPNHGLKIIPEEAQDEPIKALLDGFLATEPGRQLSNGFDGHCNPLVFPITEFMEQLNGHSIADTDSRNFSGISPRCTVPSTAVDYDCEAPGSRANGDSTDSGVLYITMFDALGRDSVGGASPINDCSYFGNQQGRQLALNLGYDAVNFAAGNNSPPISDTAVVKVLGIDYLLPENLAVHANTVHHVRLICQAIYSVAQHRADVFFPTECVSSDTPLLPLETLEF